MEENTLTYKGTGSHSVAELENIVENCQKRLAKQKVIIKSVDEFFLYYDLDDTMEILSGMLELFILDEDRPKILSQPELAKENARASHTTIHLLKLLYILEKNTEL